MQTKTLLLSSLLLCIFASSPLLSQTNIHLENIASIKNNTFKIKDEKRILTAFKESQFDTNQILILQNRYHYAQSDTGQVTNSHYQLSYNPDTWRGETQTERFPQPGRKTVYSKTKTSYKSYDHQSKYVWKKQYNKAAKLIKHTEYEYDDNGNSTYTKMQDFHSDPNLTKEDVLSWNSQNKLIKWESYDEDDTGRRKVRDFDWVYKDTLLIKSSGYVFTNWNETKNSYKGGLLSKSFLQVGSRLDNGKITINNKTITLYKDGKPIKEIDIEYKKKIKTTTYNYEPGYIKETAVFADGKTSVKEIKEIWEDGKLVESKQFLDGKLQLSEKKIYKDENLFSLTTIEFRSNGDEWKTETIYNEKGNPSLKTFYVKNKARQEDVYEYTYHPSKD